jgi:CheY-like chemotaxis protein
VVKKSISSHDFVVNYALDGESGFETAYKDPPDIILLDVEMPGANGYQVCEQLRDCERTKGIAVVFLSSQSNLRERLQGYEAGADDYLTKPFEPENLLARLNVIKRFLYERREVKDQYQLAKNAANTALAGTSEIGLAMQFMEHSIAYVSVEETILGLLEITAQFQLECCVCVENSNQELVWFSSEGAVSPLEKELVEMSDHSLRYLDFGCRTVIHYAPISLLIKNMPLDDIERYGRLKDLLPVLLSTVKTKLMSLETQNSLVEQSKDLSASFVNIRRKLFELASLIVNNREKVTSLSSATMHDLTMKLLTMGLDEDQENLLIQMFESAFTETLDAVDAGAQLRDSFVYILDNLGKTMNKQDELLETFISSQQASSDEGKHHFDDGVELF